MERDSNGGRGSVGPKIFGFVVNVRFYFLFHHGVLSFTEPAQIFFGLTQFPLTSILVLSTSLFGFLKLSITYFDFLSSE